MTTIDPTMTAILDSDDTSGFTPVTVGGLILAGGIGGGLGLLVGGAYALGVYHGMQAGQGQTGNCQSSQSGSDEPPNGR